MWGARRVAAVASGAAVLCVANVPLFAQMNSVARPVSALDRSASGVAREYVPARWSGASSGLPANLLAPGSHRTLLESMLRRSPTFARQCQRIAGASHLTIALEIAPARMARRQRARTVIDRRRGGGLTATVVIAQPAHFVELVAHELEHIIEQLDEIDLPAKASLPRSGVQALDNDGPVFETIRAHRVGLMVANEFRRAGDVTRAAFW